MITDIALNFIYNPAAQRQPAAAWLLPARVPRGGRAITMQFLGRRSYIHACGRRWGSADALLYGVLETCARSRANLRQILTSWSVFSYRPPAKIG